MSVTLSDKHVKQFISDEEYTAIAPQIAAAHELLHSKKGLGNDFTGWVDLPVDYDKEEFDRIKKAAEKIKSNTDVFVVIGIGGSYLGARAAIEFLKFSVPQTRQRVLLSSLLQRKAMRPLSYRMT